jgi:hypothetical protein
MSRDLIRFTRTSFAYASEVSLWLLIFPHSVVFKLVRLFLRFNEGRAS